MKISDISVAGSSPWLPSSGTAVIKSVTLIDILRQRSLEQPDRLAYSFLSEHEVTRSVTYGELKRRSRALAAKLQSLGLEKERALLLFPPGLDFVTGFFGCLCAGTIAVPAYPPHARRIHSRLVSIFRDSRPKAVVTTSEIRTKSLSMVAQMAELGQVEWIAVDELEDGLADAWKPPILDGESLAFLQYTSGSTAHPKGVMVSHGNLCTTRRMIRARFRPDGAVGGRRLAAALPRHGADRERPAAALRRRAVRPDVAGRLPAAAACAGCRRSRATARTTSGGPNFAYDLCVAQDRADEQRAGLDLSSLAGGVQRRRAGARRRRSSASPRRSRPAASGARPSIPATAWRRRRCSSAGGGRGALPAVRAFDAAALEQDRPRRPAAAARGRWWAAAGRGSDQRIAIVDPETRGALPAGPGRRDLGRRAERRARATGTGRRRPRATFGARLAGRRAGRSCAPAISASCADGELFVTGRLKDLIIIRGRNHYPQDIERTAEASHPALRPGCGAAFAVDARRRGAPGDRPGDGAARRRGAATAKSPGAIRAAVARGARGPGPRGRPPPHGDDSRRRRAARSSAMPAAPPT